LAKEIMEVPIAGKITRVECKVGETVSEGDVVCYIESMKMENSILAPITGKVTEIRVTSGQAVDTGDVIAVIEG
jgi:biotin carboxyl carrier protein